MAIWFVEVEMAFGSAADIQGCYGCGATVDLMTEEGATLVDTV